MHDFSSKFHNIHLFHGDTLTYSKFSIQIVQLETTQRRSQMMLANRILRKKGKKGSGWLCVCICSTANMVAW